MSGRAVPFRVGEVTGDEPNEPENASLTHFSRHAPRSGGHPKNESKMRSPAHSAHQGSLERAVEALAAGLPVVFPTDTVYGVGVAVRHAASPQAIYELKRRDVGKPVAWLVAGPEALDEFGRDVSPLARDLAHAHWPGALTLVVKANDAVPEAFCSQEGTIGLRMPASEAALALIKAVGPLATSSANVSGGRDPHAAEELDPQLVEGAAAVVQGEVPSSGVASTVVDCTGRDATVLRQGGIVIAGNRSPL